MSEDNATREEAAAMAWLVGQWGDDVIGQVRSSSLANPRLFQFQRRSLGGRVAVQPANQLAFAAVDVVLTMVEGAVELARRHAAEVLGVAVPLPHPTVPPPPVPLTPPQVTALVAQVAAVVAQVAAAAPPATPGAGQVAAGAPPAPPGAAHVAAGAVQVASAVPDPAPLGAHVSEFPLRLGIRAGESHATSSFVVENNTGRPLHTVRFGLRYLSAGPEAIIPPSHVSFEPAMFELGPHESAVVTVRIRTVDAKPGSYLGLAESGRFRQVITLEVT